MIFVGGKYKDIDFDFCNSVNRLYDLGKKPFDLSGPSTKGS